MRSLALVAILALAAPPPAAAAHCPHGQLWRIRLGQCVSLSSPLAYAYESRRIVPVAEKKDWYVEITKLPLDPPAAPPALTPDERDQAEHDAAMAAKHDELKQLLELLRTREEGINILNDMGKSK